MCCGYFAFCILLSLSCSSRRAAVTAVCAWTVRSRLRFVEQIIEENTTAAAWNRTKWYTIYIYIYVWIYDHMITNIWKGLHVQHTPAWSSACWACSRHSDIFSTVEIRSAPGKEAQLLLKSESLFFHCLPNHATSAWLLQQNPLAPCHLNSYHKSKHVNFSV